MNSSLSHSPRESPQDRERSQEQTFAQLFGFTLDIATPQAVMAKIAEAFKAVKNNDDVGAMEETHLGDGYFVRAGLPEIRMAKDNLPTAQLAWEAWRTRGDQLNKKLQDLWNAAQPYVNEDLSFLQYPGNRLTPDQQGYLDGNVQLKVGFKVKARLKLARLLK